MENAAKITHFGRLRELIDDWKWFLQQEGVTGSLPTITREIAQLPFRHLKFFIVALSLSEALPNYHPKIDLEILPFKETDLEEIRKIDRPSSAILCARRLALGQKGLVAFHQKRQIGYAWGCAEVHPQLERIPIQLEPGEVLCTDVFTTPSFRGQGVQTALSLARFHMFRDLGFHRAICYIETRNLPSLAVWQRKLGGVTVGYIDFVRFGPCYRIRCYGTEAK